MAREILNNNIIVAASTIHPLLVARCIARELFVGLHVRRAWRTLWRAVVFFDQGATGWKASSHGCTLARFTAHQSWGRLRGCRAAFQSRMSGSGAWEEACTCIRWTITMKVRHRGGGGNSPVQYSTVQYSTVQYLAGMMIAEVLMMYLASNLKQIIDCWHCSSESSQGPSHGRRASTFEARIIRSPALEISSQRHDLLQAHDYYWLCCTRQSRKSHD